VDDITQSNLGFKTMPLASMRNSHRFNEVWMILPDPTWVLKQGMFISSQSTSLRGRIGTLPIMLFDLYF
jgi:hypothetical protein